MTLSSSLNKTDRAQQAVYIKREPLAMLCNSGFQTFRPTACGAPTAPLSTSLRLDVRFLARLSGQDKPNLTDKKMNGNFTSIGGKAGVM